MKSRKPKIAVLENCLYVVVVVWTPKANLRATRPTLFEISQICILSWNKCTTSCFEKTLLANPRFDQTMTQVQDDTDENFD